MITYLTSEESIHDHDLREVRIMNALKQVGRDWLEHGNALIVATKYPTLRIWHPDSLYYLSRGGLFTCDTAHEANAIIIDGKPREPQRAA